MKLWLMVILVCCNIDYEWSLFEMISFLIKETFTPVYDMILYSYHFMTNIYSKNIRASIIARLWVHVSDTYFPFRIVLLIYIFANNTKVQVYALESRIAFKILQILFNIQYLSVHNLLSSISSIIIHFRHSWLATRVMINNRLPLFVIMALGRRGHDLNHWWYGLLICIMRHLGSVKNVNFRIPLTKKLDPK